MTLDELAVLAGEPPRELDRWHRLGLVHPPQDDSIRAELERLRLIRFALNRGYTAERLAEIRSVHGDLVGHFAERVAASTGPPVCSMEEAAAAAGIDRAVFQLLRNAAGLHDQRQAYDEDIEAIGYMKTAMDAGLELEVITQVLRILAHGTEGMAEGYSRVFHLYVHEQLRSGGATGTKLLQQTDIIGDRVTDLVEPAVVYFHRKARERAWAQDMMLHLAEEASAPSDVPGEFTRAFLFVDMSSYTPMTEAMGDTAAARVVERFSELVRDGAARCSGQVHQQIGDEFMLVFPDGYHAAMCGLLIQEAAAVEPRFPALRMGGHVGSVLYREGNYVGTSVNTAARVAAAATRHQLLVTDAVRCQLGELDIKVEAIGARRLKGLNEPVELFELRSRSAKAIRSTDPVCGMEVDEGSALARIDWQEQPRWFCSERCLRRFLEDPGRYGLLGSSEDDRSRYRLQGPDDRTANT